jgi:hypothetical protein
LVRQLADGIWNLFGIWNLEFGIYMKVASKYKILLILPLMALLSGCYEMTVQVTKLPDNTPPSDNIYISGNFNNWDPGDPDYRMRKNNDSVLEVKLPKGIGEIEYKFTRGDWSTVEKDICGFEIGNRKAFYGKAEIFHDTVMSWNDLPKPGCPSITIIIDSIPDNTPENAVFYLASNINNWDPGSRYWMFSKGPDGTYNIKVPVANSLESEYKVTRGDWRNVECDANGNDITNRSFGGKEGDELRIKIAAWKDKL